MRSITLISLSVVDENGSIQAVFERRNKDRHVQANRTELI